MIRFIRIGNQINEEENGFAFYDTISDKFIIIGNEQYFANRQEFEEAAEFELAVETPEPTDIEYGWTKETLQRLRSHIPND